MNTTPLDPSTPITTGILLFDGFEELDALGPWEVFGAAIEQFPRDRVLGIAPVARELRAAKGLRVVPDCDLEGAPPLDVIVVPGGSGARDAARDPHVLGWLRERASQARWLTSVCTGALLLETAGLLRGRRATTHWAFCDELEQRGVTVVRGERYVRDGNVVTAAGVSAGIDMALWLLGQLRGEAAARETQRYMEYAPEPPFGEP
jgi:transcriptional regulator GlxA family with amidase domain